MAKQFLLSVFLSIFTFVFPNICNAQGPTWVSEIAPIIYDNCSHCHHEDMVAPFPLMSYDDVVENALSMYFAMEEGHMPPWPADPDYRHFVGETVVAPGKVALFLEWIEGGMEFGDPDLEPDAPNYTEGGTILNQVDFVVEFEPYTLQYNTDEYRWFVIETDFEETVYINKIEVIAGLDEIVHHADISLDFSGISAAYDDLDPLPGFNSQTGSPSTNYYMNAWQPGAGPAAYPEGWGIEVPPGADFVVEIHYGPGGQEMIDNTKMNLEFVTDVQNVRAVNVGWWLNTGNMTDGPLVIPANEVTTFHQEMQVSGDKSLIAICPHMHLLGKNYKVWFETVEGDEVPLIDIPQWDFHWQFYYYFETLQKIPSGAIIKSEAVYDNTLGNEDNPNNPPITLYNGGSTADEMFLCYFIYSNYQPGDEFIQNPDHTVGVNPPGIHIVEDEDWNVYPNPVSDNIYINGLFPAGIDGRIRVLSSDGKVVRDLEIQEGGFYLPFHMDAGNLPSGLYQLEITTPEWRTSRSFVKS
jgi:hypothetical protein